MVREVAAKLGLALNEKPAKSVGDVDEMLRTGSRKIDEILEFVAVDFRLGEKEMPCDSEKTACMGLFCRAVCRSSSLVQSRQIPQRPQRCLVRGQDPQGHETRICPWSIR